MVTGHAHLKVGPRSGLEPTHGAHVHVLGTGDQPRLGCQGAEELDSQLRWERAGAFGLLFLRGRHRRALRNMVAGRWEAVLMSGVGIWEKGRWLAGRRPCQEQWRKCLFIVSCGLAASIHSFIPFFFPSFLPPLPSPLIPSFYSSPTPFF